MTDRPIVVRGGGDLGSGVALRLWRGHFRVIVLETANPIAVRRTVSLAEAVYDGRARVEEMEGRLVGSAADALAAGCGSVSVLVDPDATSVSMLCPAIVVDAIMAKRNTGTRRDMAPLVVGLGPGFTAGMDVHVVVETNRGPHLGRVLRAGSAEADTGEPGEVAGQTAGRVLRAPAAGMLRAASAIGDIVEAGAVVARVAGMPVRAGFRGLIRGLARDGLQVERGAKIGDVDPRLDPRLCTLVSDKSLAVAGGVLESVVAHLRQNEP